MEPRVPMLVLSFSPQYQNHRPYRHLDRPGAPPHPKTPPALRHHGEARAKEISNPSSIASFRNREASLTCAISSLKASCRALPRKFGRVSSRMAWAIPVFTLCGCGCPDKIFADFLNAAVGNGGDECAHDAINQGIEPPCGQCGRGERHAGVDTLTIDLHTRQNGCNLRLQNR